MEACPDGIPPITCGCILAFGGFVDEKMDQLRQWGCGSLAILIVAVLLGAVLLVSDSLTIDAVIVLFMLGALIRIYLWIDTQRRQRQARTRGFGVETGNRDEKNR